MRHSFILSVETAQPLDYGAVNRLIRAGLEPSAEVRTTERPLPSARPGASAKDIIISELLAAGHDARWEGNIFNDHPDDDPTQSIEIASVSDGYLDVQWVDLGLDGDCNFAIARRWLRGHIWQERIMTETTEVHLVATILIAAADLLASEARGEI